MATLNAIQKLNEELGSDIKNLKRCYEINERVKAEKESIEKMVCITIFSSYHIIVFILNQICKLLLLLGIVKSIELVVCLFDNVLLNGI